MPTNDYESLLGRVATKHAATAGRLVGDKVSDAVAHLHKAATNALRDTPDGKPTLARAKRSPSFGAAMDRLDGLVDRLVRIEQAAREDAYRRSYDWHRERLPQELRSPDESPSDRRVDRCRNFTILGYSVRDRIMVAVDTAKRSALASLARASTRAVERSAGTDVVEAWGDVASRSLATVAAQAIGDGATWAARMAGRDAIKAELLPDDPTMPE